MRFILLLALLLVSQPLLRAQSADGSYLKVDYLRVDSSELAPFLLGSRGEWKQHQLARIEEGTLLAWRLYRVVFPGLSGHRYNFVSVEIGASLNDFQAPDRETAAAWRGKMPSLLAFTVHSELWHTLATVHRKENPAPSRYLNPNYMRVTEGKTGEYIEMETGFAKPVHRWLTADGQRDGWEFHRLILPGGARSEIDFIALDLYRDLEQIQFGFTPEIVEKVHGDREFTFGDLRRALWSDIWELVEHAAPTDANRNE